MSDEQRPAPVAPVDPSRRTEIDKQRVPMAARPYRLLALVKQDAVVRVQKEPDDTVMTWPHLLTIEFLAAVAMSIFLLLLGLFINAPLEELANPNVTPAVAKAPWYFLWLQEIVTDTTLKIDDNPDNSWNFTGGQDLAPLSHVDYGKRVSAKKDYDSDSDVFSGTLAHSSQLAIEMSTRYGSGRTFGFWDAATGSQLFFDDLLAHQPAQDGAGAGFMHRDGGQLGNDDALGVHEREKPEKLR